MKSFGATAAVLLSACSYLLPLSAHAGGDTAYTGGPAAQLQVTVTYLCIAGVTVTKAGQQSQYFYISSPVTTQRTQLPQLEKAWHVHVEHLHPFFPPNPDVCSEVQMAGGASAQRQVIAEQRKAQQFTVIDEPFTYSGLIADDPQMRVFCESGGAYVKTWYLTELFDVAPTQEIGPITLAWREYANKTLGLTDHASGCINGVGWDGIKQHEGRKEMIAARVETTLHEVQWTYGGNAQAAQQTPPTIATPPAIAQPTTQANAPVQHTATQATASATQAVDSTVQTHGARVASAVSGQATQPARTWACRTDYFSPPGPQRVHIHYLSDVFTSSDDSAHIVAEWNSHLAATYHLVPATSGTCAPFSQARMDQIEQQLDRGGVQTVRVPWQG